jgi:hypothetical protein
MSFFFYILCTVALYYFEIKTQEIKNMYSHKRLTTILNEEYGLNKGYEPPVLLFEEEYFRGSRYPDQNHFIQWSVIMNINQMPNWSRIGSMYVPPHATVTFRTQHDCFVRVQGPRYIQSMASELFYWTNENGDCDMTNDPYCGKIVLWKLRLSDPQSIEDKVQIDSMCISKRMTWIHYLSNLHFKQQKHRHDLNVNDLNVNDLNVNDSRFWLQNIDTVTPLYDYCLDKKKVDACECFHHLDIEKGVFTFPSATGKRKCVYGRTYIPHELDATQTRKDCEMEYKELVDRGVINPLTPFRCGDGSSIHFSNATLDIKNHEIVWSHSAEMIYMIFLCILCIIIGIFIMYRDKKQKVKKRFISKPIHMWNHG